MPPAVSQEFLEDAFATWERLRRYADINACLSALRSQSSYRSLPSERDSHSLRLARRIVEVLDRLSVQREKTVDGNDITLREALSALASDVCLSISPLPGTAVSLPDDWAAAAASTPDTASHPTTAATTAASASAAVNNDWMVVAVAYRSISGTIIMEGLHVLTSPGVQLRIQMALTRLRERVAQDSVNGCNAGARPHTPDESLALRATMTLLDDFSALYSRLLAIFPCVQMMGSSHVPVALLPVFHEMYYQICEWVLDVRFSEKANPDVYVQSFEPKKLTVMLRRSNPSSPWGLRFNSHGKLSGIRALVRSASVAGENLHRLMETSRGGVSLVSHNLKEVNFSNLDGVRATEAFEKMSQKVKRLYLRLQLDPKAQPSMEQLAFFAVPPPPPPPSKREHQKKEERARHCATLVLHRDACNISWDLTVSRDMLVLGVPRGVLSPNAEAFFTAHLKQIRIGCINGVEVTNAVQIEALSSEINTIVLDLYTVPPPPPPPPPPAAAAAAELPLQKQLQTEKEPVHHLFKEAGMTNDTPSKPTTITTAAAADAPSEPPPHLNMSDGQRRRRLSVHGKVEKDSISRDNVTGMMQRGASDKPVNSGAGELASHASPRPSIEKRRILEEVPQEEGSSALSALAAVRRLDPGAVAALREKPLVQAATMDAKTRAGSKDATVFKNRDRAAKTPNDAPAPAAVTQSSTPAIVGGGNVADRVPSLNADNKTPVSFPSPPPPPPPPDAVADADAAAVSGVLVFPNEVTLELLTLHEMIVKRHSTEKKWGISLETVGQDPNRFIRVAGLPLVTEKQQRQHPFNRLFNAHKGEWRVASVNGTPASKLPELIDVMKHALKMQIKFHRRW